MCTQLTKYNLKNKYLIFQRQSNVSYLCSFYTTTRSKSKVGNPIMYMNTIRNAILFIDTPTMPGTSMPIRQLRRHVHF